MISTPTLFEAAIVCESWANPSQPIDFHRIVAVLRIEAVAATSAQVEIAREAHRRFGTRRGKPAVLNFGDRFAYALAKQLDAPLLFKGHDFAQTDLQPA